MKKIAILLCTLMLCLALAACGSNAAPEAPEAQPADTSAPAQAPAEAPVQADDSTAMNAAYGAALTTLMKDHTLPDGTDLGFEPSLNMADNQFALRDVDGDGREELIVMYSTTASAGMAGCVFAYDGEGTPLRTQVLEFPMLTFYDNGVMTAGWSHNQGPSVEFWPYNLYTYDEANDSYAFAGCAFAWEKAFAPTYYMVDAEQPFPDDADKSGTGVVYYISDVCRQLDDTVPQDHTAYAEWLASYIGSASELSLEWYGLTEENIAALMA